MKQIILSMILLSSMAFFSGCCSEEPGSGGNASCFNGVQDGDETGVDCGGSCAPCPTCDDGIQNGGETGVDCGGPDCEPCKGIIVKTGLIQADETWTANNIYQLAGKVVVDEGKKRVRRRELHH